MIKLALTLFLITDPSISLPSACICLITLSNNSVPKAVILNDWCSFAQDLINIDAEAYNDICPIATGILL